MASEIVLSCPVCLDTFETPKSLICGHSVCDECSKKLVKRGEDGSEIPCPKCRILTKIEVGKNLPTNFELKSLVDEIKKIEGEKKPCRICNNLLAKDQLWFCCETIICANCALETHNGHEMRKLLEVLEEQEKISNDFKLVQEQIRFLRNRNKVDSVQIDALLARCCQKCQFYISVFEENDFSENQARLDALKGTVSDIETATEMLHNLTKGKEVYNKQVVKQAESIILVGGIPSLDVVEYYSPTILPRQLHHYPTVSQCGHCSAVWNGLVFVTGGAACQGSINKSTKIFNCFTKDWTVGISPKIPRVFATSVYINNQWFIFGGENEANQLEKSTEIYDFEKSEWSFSVPQRDARSVGSAVELDSKIYLFGGFLHTKSADSVTSDVKMFDLQKQEWLPIRPLLSERGSLGSIVVDSSIIVSGGATRREGPTAKCDRYDIRCGTWTEIASLNEVRANHVMLNFNGTVFAMGGSGASQDTQLASVERYESRMDKWITVEPMMTRKSLFTAVVI